MSMKALLMKDLRLILRQQRGTAILFMAMVLIVIGGINSPMFGILYTVFLLPSMLISTIAYDSFDNGMPYIRALPFSVKEYVAEKYMLVVGGSLLLNIVATGFTALVQMIKGGYADGAELMICAFSAQIVILIYSAIVLPVSMRYGTEKGRIILIIVAVAIGALFGGSGSLLKSGSADELLFNTSILASGMPGLLFGTVVICVGICVVSYFICVKWMEKKEY